LTKRPVEITREMVKALQDNHMDVEKIKQDIERDTGRKVKFTKRKKFKVPKARSI